MAPFDITATPQPHHEDEVSSTLLALEKNNSAAGVNKPFLIGWPESMHNQGGSTATSRARARNDAPGPSPQGRHKSEFLPSVPSVPFCRGAQRPTLLHQERSEESSIVHTGLTCRLLSSGKMSSKPATLSCMASNHSSPGKKGGMGEEEGSHKPAGNRRSWKLVHSAGVRTAAATPQRWRISMEPPRMVTISCPRLPVVLARSMMLLLFLTRTVVVEASSYHSPSLRASSMRALDDSSSDDKDTEATPCRCVRGVTVQVCCVSVFRTIVFLYAKYILRGSTEYNNSMGHPMAAK